MKNKLIQARKRRKTRIRASIIGTSERPRLSVYRSAKYTYAQIIDDAKQMTIVAASEKELKGSKETKIQRAKMVGTLLAKKAMDKKVTAVRFDRNGYAYHGRIQALAEGAREGGLQF